MSERKAAEVAAHGAVREAVFRRDGWRCQLVALDPEHRCFGPLSPHHLLKEGQGGEYVEANLVSVCVGGNEWVEREPDAAYALGLVVRRGESVEDAWNRMEQVRRRA